MAIRIGFVGTGGIANAHFDALSQIDDVELVGFCDIDLARAEAPAGRFGGKAFNDFQKMLNEVPMDALYVCVPPHAHEGAEELAAEKGIHIFVEKPVARTLERAHTIESAIQKAGVLSMVGYHFRYMKTTQQAKEKLQGQTIVMAKGAWDGEMPGVGWWRQHALSGGQIVEQTTHIVDLARYLVGEVEEVFAYFAYQPDLMPHPNGDVSSAGVVNLKFANGAVGVITNTCVLRVPGEVGIRVYTPYLRVDVFHNGLHHYEPNLRTEQSVRENPYLNEARAFIQAIRERNPSLISADYSEGVRSLAISLAADESARTGKPVRLV